MTMKAARFPRLILLLAATAMLLASSSARAGGDEGSQPAELEVELGLLWWDSAFDMGGQGVRLEEDDAADLGFRGELWLPQSVGFVAQYLLASTADIGQTGAGEPVILGDDLTYASLDVLYRIDAVSRNNYVAVGAGWELADVAVSGAFGETSGPRAILATRFGTKAAYVYGEYAYMPQMGDMEPSFGLLEELVDVEGAEYELGAGYLFGGHVQARIGYRRTKFHMTDSAGLRHRSVSWGYLVGLSYVF